jgi:hypothetical protein
MVPAVWHGPLAVTACRAGHTPGRHTPRISLSVRLALLCVAGPSLHAGDDPKEIVRQALRINARNRQLERSYTYVQHDEERTLDSAGAVKHRESKTWDVIPLQGSQFRRLIQLNDKPLSPKEEREQAAAQQKSEAARQKTAELRARETPEQRQKRLDTRERTRRREEQEMDDALDGFDLRLVAEEQIDGVAVWVIDGAPRQGYKFKSNQIAGVLSKLQGRIWVSKSDYQPVRLDGETIGTISFGAVLARIYKGARVHVEYTHVNGEVWLPKRESFSISGRILLVKGVHAEGDSAYSNYKKFSADSRLVDNDQ